MTIDPDAFDAFEAAGWETAATAYDEFFAGVTGHAVGPLLDAAGATAGKRVLDAATGPGYVAAAASERGAAVVGIDVAASMVELARRKYPPLRFEQASVMKLPFADESFDAAVGNFLVLHLGEPERAVEELVRILVRSGGLALSTWDKPDRARLFGVVLEALSDAGVGPPTDVPAGPSFFRFADDTEFRELLTVGGLRDVVTDTVYFEHELGSADELYVAMLDGTVRMSASLRAADDRQRERVREALESRLAPYRRGSVFAVPVSIKIGSGWKVR